MRALETIGDRRVTAGRRGYGQALLPINVVAQVVLLLIGKNTFDAVSAIDRPIVARGESFPIGVRCPRESQPRRVQLITQGGVISGRRQRSQDAIGDYRIDGGDTGRASETAGVD